MDNNRILQQVYAIFSLFMVVFYVGVAIFFIFYSDFSYMDKALRVIIGSVFLFYGLFRAYRAYIKIREVFFTKNSNEN
jgi:predicted Na+-dependent transporter